MRKEARTMNEQEYLEQLYAGLQAQEELYDWYTEQEGGEEE